jgi:hypothetical protein
MRREDAKRLTIDASVARAAGRSEEPGPSRDCRLFLDAVLTVCHHASFTPDMWDEWKSHAGGMAKEWLRRMHARKKVDAVRAEPDEALRRAIADLAAELRDPDQRHAAREQMGKDVFLLEAAQAADGMVVSLDEEVHRWFARLATCHAPVQRIAWVNPCDDPTGNGAWLEAGASPLPRHRLGTK